MQNHQKQTPPTFRWAGEMFMSGSAEKRRVTEGPVRPHIEGARACVVFGDGCYLVKDDVQEMLCDAYGREIISGKKVAYIEKNRDVIVNRSKWPVTVNLDSLVADYESVGRWHAGVVQAPQEEYDAFMERFNVMTIIINNMREPVAHQGAHVLADNQLVNVG